jgi:hypothetical protein
MSVHRLDEHSLRSAQRPDGLKTAFTNAVVNRPSGNSEELRRLIE